MPCSKHTYIHTYPFYSNNNILPQPTAIKSPTNITETCTDRSARVKCLKIFSLKPRRNHMITAFLTLPSRAAQKMQAQAMVSYLLTHGTLSSSRLCRPADLRRWWKPPRKSIRFALAGCLFPMLWESRGIYVPTTQYHHTPRVVVVVMQSNCESTLAFITESSQAYQQLSRW